MSPDKPEQEDDRRPSPPIERDGFPAWLDATLRSSGVPAGAVDEGWRSLIAGICDHQESTLQEDRLREAKAALVARLLSRLPEATRQSICRGPLLNRLEQLGLQIRDVAVVQLQRNGKALDTISVSAEDIASSLDVALQKYVRAPTTRPLDAGPFTYWFRELGEGSLFLAIERVPTQFLESVPEVQREKAVRLLLDGFSSEDVGFRRHVCQLARERLGAVGPLPASWTDDEAAFLCSDPATRAAAGQRIKELLLSEWRVFSAELRTVADVAPDACVSLLGYVDPEVALKWLGIEARAITHANALRSSAKRQVEALLPAPTVVGTSEVRHEPRASGTRRIAEYCAKYLSSIFVDARIARQHLLRWAQTETMPTVVGDLLAMGEQAHSGALQANLALLAAQLLEAAPDASSNELLQRLSLLCQTVIAGPSDDEEHSEKRAEPRLSAFFYVRWSADPTNFTPAQLRYLSSRAASYVAASVSRPEDGRRVLSAIGTALEDIDVEAIRHLRQRESGFKGLFHPLRQPQYNYPGALLCKGLAERATTVTKNLMTGHLLESVLEFGHVHRIASAFTLPESVEADVWDTELPPDAAAAAANLVQTAQEDALPHWTDDELARLQFISDPDRAETMADAVATELPDLPLGELMPMLGLVFSAAGASAQRDARVVSALSDELAQRSKAEPDLRRFLLHHAALCSIAEGVSTRLRGRCRELLYDVPSPDDLDESIVVQSETVCQTLERPTEVEQAAAWLRDALSSLAPNLDKVRACLRSFADGWTGLGIEARTAIASQLRSLAHSPPFNTMWELRQMGVDDHDTAPR